MGVIYRPPDTEIQVFEVILKELKKILEKMDKPDPTVILSGDFNFPFVNWKRLPIIDDCEWEYKSYTNATKDQRAQFENLMKVCDSYFMLQTIEESTRKETTTGKENMLDLLFTNEIEIMGDVDANDTPVSDHKRVRIDTGYSMSSWHIREQSDAPGEAPKAIEFPFKGELGSNNRGNEKIAMERKIQKWKCSIEYQR